MANLFQPTYRSSNLAAPTVPGADIGAFGKSIADIKLNNLRQRQFEVETKRAEEEAQWKRDDRAQLEQSRDFMKNYNYDITSDVNRLNSSALDGYRERGKDEVEKFLMGKGIVDRQGKYIEGSEYTPEIMAEMDAINSQTHSNISNIVTTKEDVFKDAFGKAITATGNYDLATKFADSVSSKHQDREYFQKSEKERTDTVNELRTKRAQGMKRLLDATGKENTIKSTKYGQDDVYAYIGDAGVGPIDANQMSKAAQFAMKDPNVTPSMVMQALEQLKEPEVYGTSGLFSDREFENDTSGKFLEYVKSNTTKSSGGTRKLNFREEKLLNPEFVTPRSVPQILRDSGKAAFGRLDANISPNTTAGVLRNGNVSSTNYTPPAPATSPTIAKAIVPITNKVEADTPVGNNFIPMTDLEIQRFYKKKGIITPPNTPANNINIGTSNLLNVPQTRLPSKATSFLKTIPNRINNTRESVDTYVNDLIGIDTTPENLTPEQEAQLIRNAEIFNERTARLNMPDRFQQFLTKYGKALPNVNRPLY